MTHFGILCLAATGHLNTMFPLGHELRRREHRVTVLSDLKAQAQAEAAGLDFCEVYSSSIGSQACQSDKSGKNGNLANIRQTLQQFAWIAETRLQKAPAIIQERGINALLVDLSVFEGGTIADRLDLPYVTVCCMLPFYQDSAIPPIFTTWQYSSAWWARFRNQIAYGLLNCLAKPTWRVIANYRQRSHLSAYKSTNDIFSDLAIITRHIPKFEFPRQLPPHFHFTGPFHQSIKRQPVPFPFEQLSRKPLIYASMGTLQNRSSHIFYTIAEACANLDAQLVISLGGGLDPEALPSLPGKPLVVKYAPQLKLLRQASLAITHAGLNTTLEALSYGVPMVAIPITDDQPGVAARIVWTGTGELVTLSRLTVSTLQLAIQQVMLQETYKQSAVQLREALHQTGGVKHAVDIIERAVLVKKPVTS